MEPLLEAGATGHDSAAGVARASAVVVSMVADAPDVEQIALGLSGVADGTHDGLVFVDMSTIAPAAARSIAARLGQRGVDMLDAPVSGGEMGAVDGTLSIMVGGRAETFERVRPLFERMGRAITLVGGSGAGQVAKACNQIITGMAVAAVAEALNYARKAGVDAAPVRQALLGGFASSRILDNHGGRMLERNFKPGFKSWMHQKDLRIVMESAHELGLALPGAAVTAQMFNAMVGSGLGEEDSVAMLKLLERMSGDS
jgi:2-hydroxy-3-oxopropionate reductase